MIRIGILTYHRSYNYGAFMQCYSLSTRIQKDFPGCKIEVIDYMSKEAYNTYHPSFGNYFSLIRNADTSRKRKNYFKGLVSFALSYIGRTKKTNLNAERFETIVSTLPLSHKHIVTDDVRVISKYINENFDIVVVGSDAVWNFQMRPFPNIYFLGDEIYRTKMSYAASSFAQPYKNLSDDIKSYIEKSWSSYKYVGVRDVPTEDFVKHVTPSIVPRHNCDPTVFLDMASLEPYKEQVYAKLLKAGYNPNKRAIGLMANSKVGRFIKENITGDVQLISVFKHNEYADINLLDITPFEWAVCFSYFDVMITHYFHGNLLSLKNSTPTLIIEEETDYKKNYDSKIRDFMRRVGLLDNCFYLDGITPDMLNSKIEQLRTIKKEDISIALEKEARYYDSFKEALLELI